MKNIGYLLLQTSDMHGALFPYNFIEDKPMRIGL